MIDKTHIVKNNKTMLYITYAILLAFVVFNYETVFSVVGYLLSLATPLYIAIIIAFILNIPMRKIEHLYGKKIKKKGLKRGLYDNFNPCYYFTCSLLFIYYSKIRREY